MKVQCDVCEGAVATILCCADEAALCLKCDKKVHAANKLASKHPRVPLLPPSPADEDGPKCDICQEGSAFFFCREDRALLCRDCDISIHQANSLSQKHNRFLLTGIRVGLENLDGESDGQDAGKMELSAGVPTLASTPKGSKGILCSGEAQVPVYKPDAPEYKPIVPPRSHKSSAGASSSWPHNQSQSHTLHRKISLSDMLDSTVPVWGVDEILNIPNLANGYSIHDIGSTKGSDALMGDFDWTAGMGLFDDSSVSGSFHEVPQVSSPLAMVPSSSPRTPNSALKGKAARYDRDPGAGLVPETNDLFLVPDLGLLPPPAKRWRPTG